MARIGTSTLIKDDPNRACRALGWRLGRRQITRPRSQSPKIRSRASPFSPPCRRRPSEAIHRSCTWRRYEPDEPIVGYLDASDDVL